MPRPKVEPSKRQRVVEACNYCREAKKRCSGTSPCTHCQRRGLKESCIITNRPRGQRGSDKDPVLADSSGVSVVNMRAPSRAQVPLPTPSSATSARMSHDFRSPSPTDFRAAGLGVSRPGPSASLDQSHPRRLAEGSNTPVLSVRPKSRMLFNLRGERVYLGEGASLSFLQLIRGIVSDQIGPSPFSRPGRSDNMLEKESPESHIQVPGLENVRLRTKMMYADYFYGVTGGILDVFLPQELESLLSETTHDKPSSKSLVNLVAAIGLQCDPSSDTHDCEMAYFREAQAQCFSSMLEDPDINMVRCFLIMSFYLLGECRRNTAFMYLGIAARASVALGLHGRETYSDMNDPAQQLRLRVWMSLRVLDIIVNSILGRPAATAGIHCDLEPLIDQVVASNPDRGLICLAASYKLVALIDGIITKLYDKKEVTIAAVEEHLHKLDRWSQGLPSFLRTAPSHSGPLDSSAEKAAIGSVHVSCFYYFAVTLATRPILISSLTQQSTAGLAHPPLALACLEAAAFIVQTCTGARESSLLQVNMCILKAIIFPAGLVLGFEIFAKSSADHGIEAAFHGARDLLDFLGAKSPQAVLYRDILTSLSNAITERRGRSSAKGRSSYVSKIFNFEQRQDSAAAQQETAAANDTGEGSCFTAASEDDRGLLSEDVFANWSMGQNTPVGASGEVFLDWAALDNSQWDSFPYIPSL